MGGGPFSRRSYRIFQTLSLSLGRSHARTHARTHTHTHKHTHTRSHTRAALVGTSAHMHTDKKDSNGHGYSVMHITNLVYIKKYKSYTYQYQGNYPINLWRSRSHQELLTLTAMQRTETLPCQVLILVFCHSCCSQTTFLDQICSCCNLPNILF